MKRDATIQYLPNHRRVWGRSLFAAASLHVVLSLWLLRHYSAIPTLANVSFAPNAEINSQSAPLVVATPISIIDSSDAPPSQTIDPLPTAPAAAPMTAVEPDMDYLSRAAQSLLTAANKPLAPDAMTELARRAKTLEQISSSEEVARITSRLRDALNTPLQPNPRASANDDGTPFDYNRCLLTNSQRVEQPDRVEIQETLADPAGHVIVISYIRRIDPATRKNTYVQSQIDRNGEQIEFTITAEEFDEAVSRNRPYQLINRFSLVKQIHDQAVLPILQKLSDEAPTTAPAPEPATTSTSGN